MMPGQERGEREAGAGWSGSDEGEREVEEGARERWSTAAGFPVNGERRPRANVQSGQETTSRPRAHVPPLLSSAPPSSGPSFLANPSSSPSPSSPSSFSSSRRVAKGETAAAAAATRSRYRAFVRGKDPTKQHFPALCREVTDPSAGIGSEILEAKVILLSRNLIDREIFHSNFGSQIETRIGEIILIRERIHRVQSYPPGIFII